jgi:hypothetical protein
MLRRSPERAQIDAASRSGAAARPRRVVTLVFLPAGIYGVGPDFFPVG